MSRPPLISEELVELVAEMLARAFKKGDIKKAIYVVNGALHGKPDGGLLRCSTETSERILKEARALLVERAKAGRSSFEQEAIEMYRSVIRDEGASPRDRLRAQEQLVELVGAGAKHRSRAEAAEPADKAREIAHLLRAMQDSTGGGADEP